MVSARRSIAPDVCALHDDGSVTLLGGYSPSSGLYHFPRGEVCPYTGAADVEAVELTREGTLWGWTAVTAPPPGYEGTVPYGFGVVELAKERLRVITRLTEPDPSRLAFGDAMHLVADAIAVDDDGTEVVTWAFAAGGAAQ
jgi:uncharacterized OB-fold protein